MGVYILLSEDGLGKGYGWTRSMMDTYTTSSMYWVFDVLLRLLRTVASGHLTAATVAQRCHNDPNPADAASAMDRTVTNTTDLGFGVRSMDNGVR